MNDDPDLAMILADMRHEFLEGTSDRLDEVDLAIRDLLAKRGDWNNNLLEIKRNVHSIKGGSSTFGFPTVSMIAHSLEDYLETSSSVGQTEIEDVQFFIDRIREIVDQGDEPEEEIAARILNGLPTRKRRGETVARPTIATVLLLMPKGLQRKIIGQELSSFGFRVLIADTALKAIDLGLTIKPNLVVASMVLDRMSGVDLARVFQGIEATRQTRILLMTASDLEAVDLAQLPGNATVIRKGITFARDFMEFLRREGLTGTRNS